MSQNADSFAAQVNAKIRVEQARIAAEMGISVDELMERVAATMRKARQPLPGVLIGTQG